MAEKIDWIGHWGRACAGTQYARDADRDLARGQLMAALVTVSPSRTTQGAADELRRLIGGRESTYQVAAIAVRFLAGLPPATTVRQVVGGLWV